MDQPLTTSATIRLTADTHAELVALAKANKQGQAVEAVLRYAMERSLPFLLQERRQLEEARRNGLDVPSPTPTRVTMPHS